MRKKQKDESTIAKKAIVGGLITLSVFIKHRYPLDFDEAQIELNEKELHLHYASQTILWNDILKCTYHEA